MEIENLLSSLDNDQILLNTAKNLEKYVGPENKITLEILNRLIALPHKPNFLLRIAALILLENVDFKKSVHLLVLIFENCSIQERFRFINEMSKSKFYVQRMCVPYLIRLFWFDTIDFMELFERVEKNEPVYKEVKKSTTPELKEIILSLLNDEVEYIIKKTILVLTENLLNILNRGEIEEIIARITKESFNLQPMIVNLCLLIAKDDFPLDNWKVRINYAKLCHNFLNPRVLTLAEDESEEVRICLSNNLMNIKKNDELVAILLTDKNPFVKSNVIKYLCLTNQNIPNDIINESWEVKLSLLKNCQSLKYIDLVIGTINSLKDSKNWRVRKSVLDFCYKILLENKQLERNEMFIPIKEVFLSFIYDKVSEIRNALKNYVLEFEVEDNFIRKVLLSPNFKYRMIIIKYIVKNKIIWGIKELSRDILEIRKELINEVNNYEINEDILNILHEMINCEEKEIKDLIENIINQ
ncbi:hypothetical protein H311_03129 [Anncaliia algerae PRA109]|nr:hypothetical protein H311_03129 [Anncaliia algerae PRA109]